MLEIKNLSKQIDGATIIENINLEIGGKQLIGLIGRNGTGKTTLFRTLANYYIPTTGTCTIDGHNPTKETDYREDIFYIDEQYNPLVKMSLKKNIELYDLAYLKFDAQFAFDLVRKTQLPLNKKYRQMSKGMQALFKIILAVSSNSKYILLDEPFDGLDVIVKKNAISVLLDGLEHSESSIIISSHQLPELESIVSRILVLRDHTIVRDYQLDEARITNRKVQIAFADGQIPTLISEHASHIEQNGSIILATFNNYNAGLKAEILALSPVVFDELDVTLEDVFTQELKNKSDELVA
ncbi:MAG: ATP-binding cassette domain-containing protein [Lactobacillales bacterium]|jgi:ABC-2 type transport system ATP-binding protein|nr:ATP-binding cassette domain-containing protein [Lactobacillales bacterium]